MKTVVEKIISGGQTGVDRAALDQALALDIPCGGWCPEGRRVEDGTLPAAYPLRQTAARDTAARTELNAGIPVPPSLSHGASSHEGRPMAAAG